MLKARPFNFLGISGLADAASPADFRTAIDAEQSGTAADSLVGHVNTVNPHTQYQLISTAFDGVFTSLTGTPNTLAGYGITDAATAAQGALAESALQPGDPIPQTDVTGLTSALADKADLVGGVIPSSQIPAIAVSEYLGSVADESAMLALTGQSGDWCTRQDTGSPWMLSDSDATQLSNWIQFIGPAAPVTSVNTQTGAVTLGKSDIGLPNVDNTADIDKPVSTATQAAIQAAKEALYPVGSIYINATNPTNPGTLLGFGTWVAFGAGRVPVGFDSGDTDFDTAEKTGGEKSVALTASQNGPHTHSGSIGSNGSHTHQVASDGSLGAGNGNFNEVPGWASGVNFGWGGRKIGNYVASSAGSHTHSLSINSNGSGDAHNNLQPYITVYMWKRTA